jgi:hypothetical protein
MPRFGARRSAQQVVHRRVWRDCTASILEIVD